MRRALLGLCVLCVLATGCKNTPRDAAGVPRGPAPDYAAVAAAYNARVAPLDRLWSTTTVRVWYPNEQGEEENAQVEGHLQYLSPWRFSLTFEKLGEVYAALGSNEQKYWWIELQKARVAHVGEHSQVTPERIAKLGLPVHPLDLVEILGITPLPVAAGEVRWSEDAKSLVVTVAGRRGPRRLWLDPAMYEPSRVELLDAEGATAVSATLGSYERVEMVGRPDPPRVATKVLAEAQHRKLRVRLTLYAPLVSPSKPKPQMFDLDQLIKAWGVQRIDPLDEAPAIPAGG